MKKLIIVSLILIFSACSPIVTTNLNKSYETLNYKEDVKVFEIDKKIPSESEELGFVSIKDGGASVNCGYDKVIELAKEQARKNGGNAIKIIDHKLPNIFGSSCHQIVAKIYKVNNFNSNAKSEEIDSQLINADYALIHFYRPNGKGFLINYDVHLGDTVLCRAKNNWKTTVKVYKDGLNTIWAQTEVKSEIPINVKYKKHYYVRCSLNMGALVGRPYLELVNNDIGKIEYESINY